MRKAAFLSVAFVLSVSVSLSAQQLRGDYIESRSTDVYVAQCFANGEVGLTGNFALMAWHVEEGAWNGVKLDGLTDRRRGARTGHARRSLRRSVSRAGGSDGRQRC